MRFEVILDFQHPTEMTISEVKTAALETASTSELWCRPGISITSTQQNSSESEWILRELFGLRAIFLAQKLYTDSESEQSYNSDDSGFKCLWLRKRSKCWK